ncbi:helix-turn-helix domain-containing protein [Gandjariella thermophila]|uniref:Transcriptional regulator n=1 Tax=Gandjariella thermophila TaxID=1931992 RepID=A0A4D4JBX7_9PSEU|nr:helix-turn-helix transcriptional regulator [Gandjariella thermophila]GDY32842.1 transcriptional regulator [Gandjariella thermophila]
MTVLLREAIGDRLRHARTSQQRTLREVSRAARVSLGYLSEVERGRKEPSSELLAAICEALDLRLSELLHRVAADVDAVEGVTSGESVPPRVPEPESARQPAPAEASAGDGRLECGELVSASVGEELCDLRLEPMLSHRLSTPLGDARGVVVAA